MTSSETLRRDSSGSSGALPRLRAWWDPRRSLGARLLWILIPGFLLAATVYRAASSRLWQVSEDRMTALLVEDAVRLAGTALRQSADRRMRQVSERSGEILAGLREAAAMTAAALEKGPPRGVPAEVIVEDESGVARTRSPGPSAAVVAPATEGGPALTAVTRYELAATSRLVAGFSALQASHSQISTAFVLTRNGVLRAVPGYDVSRIVTQQTLRRGFVFPRRWNGVAPSTSLPVHWTAPYEDLYAGRGRIVSVMTPVFSTAGQLVAEVGLDWAFGDLFARVPEVGLAGEAEVVFDSAGVMVLKTGEQGFVARGLEDARERGRAFETAARGDAETEIAMLGSRVLLVSRRVPATGWTYARLVPVDAVRDATLAQVAPILEENRQRRHGVQNAFFATLVLLGGALVAIARRAIAPVRRIAGYADAVTEGEVGGEPEGVRRADEVGRLARAIRNLQRRMSRRVRVLGGMHDIARTASMMTSPAETHARLSRRIAELVGAAKAWIGLWEPEKRCLVFRPPGYGFEGVKRTEVEVGLDDRALSMEAFKSGETLVSGNIWDDDRASQRIAAEVGVQQTAAFVPLKTEAGTLGVLAVFDKPGGFDGEDLAAIQSYADQAALLLRNARLYEELQHSYERLRDAQRNRDYFLQNVNHELRTPLTAILGWIEVLADDKPEPPVVATAVEQIRRSAEFLLTMISDLLDLSRVESGGVTIEPRPTDVGALVREAIEPVAVMAEAKGITVTTTAPPPGTETARLDPQRVRQVLWNLVHNAVKFTPARGRIDVSVQRENGGMVLFRVADDGVGIDPKDLPFIFDRFRQADGSTTRAYRGTGIGLSLARSYVELHGGRIEVVSQPGRGAEFLVRIPG